MAEFDTLYGKGISRSSEIFDYAIKLELIKKSGSWFSYNGERIGQGKANVRRIIEDDPAMMAELEAKIRDMSEQAAAISEEFELDEDRDDSEEDFDVSLMNGDNE